MDPKVLAVLGMGGLMFFLFLIVGIVVWINSEEEDDSSSGSSSGSGSGSGSGGDGISEAEMRALLEDDEDDVCGAACLAALVATGQTTVTDPFPSSDGRTGTQTLSSATASATSVGMPEAAAISSLCTTGYVAKDNVCYPICDNYGTFGSATGDNPGAPTTQVPDNRKYYSAKGSSGATSGCGTTDGGSNKASGDTDGKIQAMQTGQFGFCDKVFAKDSASTTGYTICHASGGRCRASYTTDFPKIDCIPKNAMTGVRKAPECSENWLYGTRPDSTDGVINWGDEGHGCKCHGASQTVSVHDGTGNWWAENTWRCPTDSSRSSSP